MTNVFRIFRMFILTCLFVGQLSSSTLLNKTPPQVEGVNSVEPLENGNIPKPRQTRDGGHGYRYGGNPMMMILPYLLMQNAASAARQDTPGAAPAAPSAANTALLMSMLGGGGVAAGGYHSD